MSALVSRLLLSMLMFPLAAMVYLITVVMGWEVTRKWSGVGFGSYRDMDNLIFTAAGLVTAVFIGIYWMLLWARSVRWRAWRIGAIIGLTFGAIVVGAAVGALVVVAVSGPDASFGIFVGTVVAPLLWLTGSIFIWRETAAERVQRVAGSRDAVVCPTCGYNLTGLTSTRCPECGATLTLDVLMRSQPARPGADLERA